MEIPGWMMPHRVSVETYTGDSGYGDNYRPAVVVQCSVDELNQLVRDKNGDEVVSSATLRARQSEERRFTLDSRVTVRGVVAYVISTSNRDDGGLGTAQHLEVHLS